MKTRGFLGVALLLAAVWSQPVFGQTTLPRIREVDGNPSVNAVREIVVSNGTLTDDGARRVTLVTGGGGGGGFDATAVDSVTWSDGANASNVWTFDVSGTDPTITFGNALVTFNSPVVFPSFTLGATAVTATGAELNFVDGVTSAIQGQLDGKVSQSDYTIATWDSGTTYTTGAQVFYDDGATNSGVWQAVSPTLGVSPASPAWTLIAPHSYANLLSTPSTASDAGFTNGDDMDTIASIHNTSGTQGSGSFVRAEGVGTISDKILKNAGHTLYDATSDIAAAAVTLSFSNGHVQKLSVTDASTEITLPSGSAGTLKSLLLIIEQDVTGGRSITFAAGTPVVGNVVVNEVADAATYLSLTYDGTDDPLISSPSVHVVSKTLAFPDLLQAEIDAWPLFPVETTAYPNGIVVLNAYIKTSASSSYSLVFEDWSDPVTASADIATVATSTSTEASSTDIFAEVAAGSIVMADLPTTDIAWVEATFEFIEQ